MRQIIIASLFLIIGGPAQSIERANLPKQGKNVKFKSMSRWVGQQDFTDFYGWIEAFMPMHKEMASPVAAPSAGSSQRSVQESDIFKYGAPESKAMYFLNSYRGLQVISFEKGVEAPEVVGRVKPTGNEPKDMYVLKGNKHLLVLENNWFESGYWSENQSRVLVYDVTNSKEPKISQKLNVKGKVTDHRMVGDVLYVVTRVTPGNGTWEENRKNASGYVYSFDLSSNKAKQVDLLKLAIPPSRNQGLMNIQETYENGQYKYYIVASLNVSGWFWSSNETTYVEVIDISSAKGEIKPLMVTAVKGEIKERSNTLIKDGSLVVVSNYNLGWDSEEKARIAVEMFSLPNEKSQVVNQSELNKRQALYDKLLGESSVNKMNAGYAAYHNGAIQKSNLKNVFTEDENIPYRLFKPMPDQVITVGDSRGQNALLQDVRVEKDLMYVFWVPVDRIDPLDIFDLSDVKSGKLTHVEHLEFEGWVEKSFPVSYKGKSYIIGLGFIEPTVNNEGRARFPQVYVFEIVKRGSKYKAFTVYEKMFKGETNFWSKLNSQDKFFEFKMNDKGVAELLFPFYAKDSKSGRYSQGGKLAYVDLEAVYTNSEEAIKEGGFLVGDQSWLERVFYNTEIERFNTLTDKNLYIYEKTEASLKATTTVQVAKALELAKNIRDVIVIDHETVVQVVSEESYCYYYECNEKSVTELRFVSSKNPDARVQDVNKTQKLEGSYAASFNYDLSNYVITAGEETFKETSYKYEDYQGKPQTQTLNAFHSKVYRLYKVSKGGAVKEIQEWEEFANSSRGFYRGYASRPSLSVRPFEGDKFLLFNSDKSMTVFDASLNKVKKLTNRCGVKDKTESVKLTMVYEKDNVQEQQHELSLIADTEVKVLNKKPYIFWKEVTNEIKSKTKKASDGERFNFGYSLSQSYIVPMNFENGAVTCDQSKKVNIPGEPLKISGNNLLTENSWYKDASLLKNTSDFSMSWGDEDKSSEFKKNRKHGYLLTQLKNGKAVLGDALLTKDSYNSTLTELEKGHYLFTEPAVEMSWSDRKGVKSFEQVFSFISLKEKTFDLKKSYISLKGYSISHPQVVSVAKNRQLLVVDSGKGVELLESDSNVGNVKKLSFNEVDSLGDVSQEDLSYVKFPGYSNKVKVDVKSGYVDFIRGYYGVSRYKINR